MYWVDEVGAHYINLCKATTIWEGSAPSGGLNPEGGAENGNFRHFFLKNAIFVYFICPPVVK